MKEIHNCDICFRFIDSNKLVIKSINVLVNNELEIKEFNLCSYCHTSLCRCTLCDDCFSIDISSSCGVRQDNSTYICAKCIFNRNYYRCVNCGLLTKNTTIICNNCEYILCVNRYSYKPIPKFFGKSNRYFGVELEISCDRKLYKELHDLIDTEKCYLKEDSSIEPQGYELVTHPMTINEHRKFWKEFCSNIVNDDRFFIFNKNNGLHIHINRDNLSSLLIGKLIRFTFKAKPYMILLSDRVNTEYASFHILTTIKSVITNKDYLEKYCALNIKPKNTIEFRTFKASFKYEEINTYIEFCDAIINYCNNKSVEFIDKIEIKNLIKDFYLFVIKNKKSYPNLYTKNNKLKSDMGVDIPESKSSINKKKYEEKLHKCAS